MMPGAGMGGGRSRPQPKTDHERRAARLMDLITTAVDPGTWQDTGGFGTISEYEGLIVVNHNARTHKKIENVLSMLRQSAGMPENAVMPGMGHGMMGGMGGAMMGAGGGFLAACLVVAPAAEVGTQPGLLPAARRRAPTN
jgi:hypothetical protein